MRSTRDQCCAIRETFRTIFEEFDQATPPGLQFGFSVWITSDIVRFMGILLQIEEVILTRLGIPDVFVTSIGDIVVAVIVSIAACVFSVQTLPNVVGIALHDRQEALACAGIGNVDAGGIQDSGHNVLNADRALAGDFFGIPPSLWGAHEKRNSG